MYNSADTSIRYRVGDIINEQNPKSQWPRAAVLMSYVIANVPSLVKLSGKGLADAIDSLESHPSNYGRTDLPRVKVIAARRTTYHGSLVFEGRVVSGIYTFEYTFMKEGFGMFCVSDTDSFIRNSKGNPDILARLRSNQLELIGNGYALPPCTAENFKKLYYPTTKQPVGFKFLQASPENTGYLVVIKTDEGQVFSVNPLSFSGVRMMETSPVSWLHNPAIGVTD